MTPPLAFVLMVRKVVLASWIHRAGVMKDWPATLKKENPSLRELVSAVLLPVSLHAEISYVVMMVVVAPVVTAKLALDAPLEPAILFAVIHAAIMLRAQHRTHVPAMKVGLAKIVLRLYVPKSASTIRAVPHPIRVPATKVMKVKDATHRFAVKPAATTPAVQPPIPVHAKLKVWLVTHASTPMQLHVTVMVRLKQMALAFATKGSKGLTVLL